MATRSEESVEKVRVLLTPTLIIEETLSGASLRAFIFADKIMGEHGKSITNFMILSFPLNSFIATMGRDILCQGRSMTNGQGKL